ncbi:hypothetical protein TrST_g7800 [Triparma strigata]|uniref:CXXC-type domain-containing protein n=1 Tax=Triparma strigata TaxID=1606541 RepID=A0A9W7B5F8_9STRA|nr:hypothetical protein TrST_g7800 [Triparma strigata]
MPRTSPRRTLSTKKDERPAAAEEDCVVAAPSAPSSSRRSSTRIKSPPKYTEKEEDDDDKAKIKDDPSNKNSLSPCRDGGAPEERWACPDCGKSWSRRAKTGWDYHTKNKVCTVSVEKRKSDATLKCKNCSKTFISRDGLDYHVKNNVCQVKSARSAKKISVRVIPKPGTTMYSTVFKGLKFKRRSTRTTITDQTGSRSRSTPRRAIKPTLKAVKDEYSSDEENLGMADVDDEDWRATTTASTSTSPKFNPKKPKPSNPSKATAKKPSRPRQRSCGICASCKAPNCGTCSHCLDMPAFGGKGTTRQRCKYRTCWNKISAGGPPPDDASFTSADVDSNAPAVHSAVLDSSGSTPKILLQNLLTHSSTIKSIKTFDQQVNDPVWDETCVICHLGGSLMCCEFCSNVCHKQCFTEFNTLYILKEPDGDYICNFCADNIKDMVHGRYKGEEEIYDGGVWGAISYNEVFDVEAPKKKETEKKPKRKTSGGGHWGNWEYAEEVEETDMEGNQEGGRPKRKAAKRGRWVLVERQMDVDIPPSSSSSSSNSIPSSKPAPSFPTTKRAPITTVYRNVFESLKFRKGRSHKPNPKKRPASPSLAPSSSSSESLNLKPSPLSLSTPPVPVSNVKLSLPPPNPADSALLPCSSNKSGCLGCCPTCSKKWAASQLKSPATSPDLKFFETTNWDSVTTKPMPLTPKGLKISDDEDPIGTRCFLLPDDCTEYVVVDKLKDFLLVQKFEEKVGGHGVVLKVEPKELTDAREVKKKPKIVKKTYSDFTGRFHPWARIPKIFKNGSMKSPEHTNAPPPKAPSSTPKKTKSKAAVAQSRSPAEIWKMNNASHEQRTFNYIRLPLAWAVHVRGSAHFNILSPDNKIFVSKRDAFDYFKKKYPKEYKEAEEERDEEKRGTRKYGKEGISGSLEATI